MKTKVIFRKFPAGDVIALFPELPGNYNPATYLSYQHIGQHGAASVSLTRRTALATKAESAELARELRRIGYKLREVKRFTRKDYEAREKSLID